MSKPKYCVVGGCPFRSYTGTMSFTGLQVVGTCDTDEELRRVIDDAYQDCGGLVMVIDLEIGKESTV